MEDKSSKLSDLLEKIESKYPDDEDVMKLREEWDAEEEGEDEEGSEMEGMEEEEGPKPASFDELSAEDLGEEEDEFEMPPKKKKKKPAIY